MVVAIFALSLCVQCALGGRVFHNEFKDEKQVSKSAHSGVPLHWRKYAAKGTDLKSFLEKVEQNKLLGNALLKANTTEPVEQDVFCPLVWCDRLSKTAIKVGEGTYGKVYVADVVCNPRQHQQVAIKVQKYNSDAEQESIRMETLNHPNIIKAFEHVKGPSGSDFSLLMESAPGGDFFNIERLSSSEKARLLMEAFNGIAYMHEQGLVHVDLKQENILLSSDCAKSTCHAKVADLGLTARVGEAGTAGTPTFLAPELLRTERYEASNDLWSMGVMIHEIFKGSFPFKIDDCYTDRWNNDCLVRAIVGQRTPYHPVSREPVEELLKGLLQPNPANRLSAKRAAEICERWWRGGSSVDDIVPLPTLPSCWAGCGRKRCKEMCRVDKFKIMCKTARETQLESVTTPQSGGSSLDSTLKRRKR